VSVARSQQRSLQSAVKVTRLIQLAYRSKESDKDQILLIEIPKTYAGEIAKEFNETIAFVRKFLDLGAVMWSIGSFSSIVDS
jgi:allophanate hydrolase subunit 1